MAEITFYGTRGSYPLSGEKYMEYGGATTCILLRFDSAVIMVDCGTGANNAISDLKDVEELHLFISHSHNDHINGFVTLLPAFANKKLHVYSKTFNGIDIKDNIDRVMSQPLWPISCRDIPNVQFHELEDVVKIGDVVVTNMDSNHPGGCTLYRFDDPTSSIVTAFDFSHLDGYGEKLLKFAEGCKVMIYDGNMDAAELAKNPTWGHSTPETGCIIGEKLGLEKLYITHHGNRTDDELSEWETRLRQSYPFLEFARSGRHRSEAFRHNYIGNAFNSERGSGSLADDNSDILYGFAKVISIGIDERTPYNANHTKNMVHFADNFLDYEVKEEGKYKVDPLKRKEILMSIWLHDIGKLLTPLNIMNKDSRLGGSLAEIASRHSRRDLLLRLSLAKGEIDEAEYEKEQKLRNDQYNLILKINRAGLLTDELQAELDDLSGQVYRELDGNISQVITQEEYNKLCIKKGTLTKDERSVMENHVVLTQKLLSQLEFPKNYEKVPYYAGSHHEFLDGSGYPDHLTAKDLEWPCRLITILDIFEALVAKDRPYKKPFPLNTAIDILREMAVDGKLDADIVEEFAKSKAWE